MKHYIIGDIHGEYQTLLALDFLQNSLESATLVPNNTRPKPSSPSFARSLLVKRLPKDAKLIFVGDYISRGKQSKEVVSLDLIRHIRKNEVVYKVQATLII